MKRTFPLIEISAVQRLVLCISISILVLLLLLIKHFEVLTGFLFAWDSFSLSMIIISWIIFFMAPYQKIGLEAKTQDESSSIIFIIVVCSVCISFIGILFLLQNKNATLQSKELHTVAAMPGIAFSWILLHTTFTFRYAHLYYTDSLSQNQGQQNGLIFPEETKPDYIDFAYFSFVIGMTFQVSDVQITSRTIRRFVLLHSIISFIFNTVIVALTISMVSNLV